MKTKLLILALPLLILSIFLSGCATGMTPSSWPGMIADKDTAYVSAAAHVYAVQVSNGVERWRFPQKPDAKKQFYAAPTLTSDGQLIVGGYDHILYSLSPADGSINWTFADAKDRWIGSAAVSDKMIFAPSADFKLYALNMKGELQWSFTAGASFWSQPAVDGQKVYAASLDHTIYALNIETGKLAWSSKLDGGILGSLTLGADGKLYASTLGGNVYALDSSTGKTVWKKSLSSWVWSGPVLADGNVYTGDSAGMFVSMLADTGKENWTVQPDGAILGSPLVLGNMIVFGTESGSLIAVDSSKGSTTWTKSITGNLYGSPVLAGDLILVAPEAGDVTLIALDQNGAQQWVYTPVK
jgi:outer membrane protein assembly factor BamB